MRRIISLLLAFALIIATYSDNIMSARAEKSGYALNRADFLSGDINSNGSVDLSDVVVLAQYVAGWKVDCFIGALDPNGDTYCDLEDVAFLAKYVAGWQEVQTQFTDVIEPYSVNIYTGCRF